jgi:small subunit ribosomal protein S7
MAKKREIYIVEGSTYLKEKFINCLMKQGKKSIARRIFNDSMKILIKKGQKYPEKLFERAIDLVKPNVEVRPKRIGGAVYQIPVEVNPHRQLTLAVRWIIKAIRDKKGKATADKLSDELLLATQEQGNAFKKKMDVFKMAQANKAFAHFAKY